MVSTKLFFTVTCFVLTEGLIIKDMQSGANVIPEHRARLVVDHDGGADDAMAIFMALLYEKYFKGPQVVGVTTVHGNVDEPQAFLNTQRILDIAGRRDVPIYRGSDHALVYDAVSDGFFGCDGLGDLAPDRFEPLPEQPEHAVLELIEMAKTYREDLIIVTLGPLTNIALALRLYPQLIQQIGHLYVGAGNIYEAETWYGTEAEFNARTDAEAYHIVTRHATPAKVTLVPYSQIRNTLNLTQGWRMDKLGSIPSKIMKAQNSFERVSRQKESSFWSMLDPATMAIALDNHVADRIQYSNNSIVLTGGSRGIVHNTFSDPCEANVKIVYSCNQEAYKDILLAIFTAELL